MARTRCSCGGPIVVGEGYEVCSSCGDTRKAGEMTTEQNKFEGWVVLELMGHRRLAGFLSEQQIAGSGFLRLDVYAEGEETPNATPLYSPSAVYCITPTTENLARRFSNRGFDGPVQPWELRRIESPRSTVSTYDPDEDDADEDDDDDDERV